MSNNPKFTKITSDGNVICNEDGRMLELPVNKLKDQFVGNVIIQNWFDEDD